MQQLQQPISRVCLHVVIFLPFKFCLFLIPHAQRILYRHAHQCLNRDITTNEKYCRTYWNIFNNYTNAEKRPAKLTGV